MKVYQVHNQHRQPGGEDVAVEAEARLLRQAGHEVGQYVVRNPSRRVDAAARLAFAPWNPRASRRLASSIPNDAEIVHVHNTWFSLSPSVLSALHNLGYPVVVTLHNYRVTCSNGLLLRDGKPCRLCVTGSAFNAVRYTCYRDSTIASASAAATVALHRLRGTWAKEVDVVVTLSQFAKGQFTAAGIPEDRIMVKPNFTWDPGVRTLSPSDSDRALFVGRLSHEKGIELLVRAWRIAALADLRLIVLGDGPLRAKLSDEATENIEFRGHVNREEVITEMKRARFLAYPSQSFEGAPMAILESLSAGLPVLASSLGAVPELVRTGGVPVSPATSVEAWGQGLHTMINDTLIDALSEEARSVYEIHYSPTVALDQAVGVYRRALDIHTLHGG